MKWWFKVTKGIFSQIKKHSSILFILGYSLILGPLIYSVFQSGFHYLFNGDEFCHIQTAYLILNGERPFDTFFSGYTPIFHWFIAPIYYFIGFNFKAIFFNRFVMIVLLGLRILVTFFLVRKIFGKWIALLFIPLSLFDVFTVYSGMQVRPDNLALFFLALGLLCLVYGLERRFLVLLPISGFILSLSVLTLLKTLPSVFFTGIVIFAFLLFRRRYKDLSFFISGLLLSVLILFGYFFIRGSITELINQVFIEPAQILNYWWSYAPFGMFLNPYNENIYGLNGRPVSWVYMWVLLFMGAIGIFQTYLSIVQKRKLGPETVMRIILVLSAFGQWVSLFFVVSVYVQYYMQVTWLITVFSAVFIAGLLDSLVIYKKVRLLTLGIVILLIFYVGFGSVKANLARAKVTWSEQVTGIEASWKKFPEKTLVYPNILFRPLAYPLPPGYYLENFPKSRLDKLPDLPTRLEQKKVQYLTISDSTLINFADFRPNWKYYIETHFEKDQESGIWHRIQ